MAPLALSHSFVEGSRDDAISPKEVRMLLMGAGHPKNDNKLHLALASIPWIPQVAETSIPLLNLIPSL